MKIKWLGHAAFILTAEDGTKIITDPYIVGGGIGYGEIKESADIVTISHGHGDHNNAASIKGNPQVLNTPGSQKIRNVEIRGYASYHDSNKGKQRGNNVIFGFKIDGITLCHLGDLGHSLDDKTVSDIGQVDILFIPVGGFFTIDATTATGVINAIKPRVIIPMHFLTPKVTYPIVGVEDFLKGKSGVKKSESSEIEIKNNSLPVKPEIIVLKHAL